MTTTNRTVMQTQDAQSILGIQKDLMNLPTMNLGGTAITPADLIKRIQARIDSANAIAAAKAKWQDLVQANKALSQSLTPILRGLRQYLLNTYGEANAPLADFGMTPPKKVTKSPEVKAAAAQKGAATRLARHTGGKNQKKLVKGTVTTTATPPAPSGPTATANQAAANSAATVSAAAPQGTPAAAPQAPGATRANS